jgi:hypothetical protein
MNGVYDCATCDSGMRQILGHDGPPQSLWRENLVTDEPLAECPLRTIIRASDERPELAREVARHAEEYFPDYEAGHLLVEGGSADQPALTMDYMRTLKGMRAAQERKWVAIQEENDKASAPQPSEDR